MLKMFSTQLTGLFKRIMDKEEFSFEDTARLLAQARVGEGSVILYADKEMKGVLSEAFEGFEPLEGAKVYTDELPLAGEDRYLLFTRHSDDDGALALARKLQQEGIPFAAAATSVSSEGEDLKELADVFIDLNVKRGLLPNDDGSRFGMPALMAALFVYYGIKFTLEEILSEY